MSVLVFDWGLKDIGVAVADEAMNMAFPLTTITTRAGKFHQASFAKMFKEYQPRQVVVGMPLNMDGTETEYATSVKKFAHEMHLAFNVEVSFVDERLTTFEAVQRSGEEIPDDSLAAQVIAESWLNQNKVGDRQV